MNDRELLKLAHAASLNARLVDIHLTYALAAITAKLDHLDGYSKTASGSDSGPHGTSDTSVTERATLQRLGEPERNRPGVSHQRDELEDWLLTASKSIKQALVIMDRFMGDAPLTPAERQRLRCTGTGDAEGSTCWQWAVLDGRCIDCNRTVKAERERKRYHQAKGAA